MPDQFGNPTPGDMNAEDAVTMAFNEHLTVADNAFSNVIPFQKPDAVAVSANAADRTGISFDEVADPAQLDLTHKLDSARKELAAITGQPQFAPMLRWINQPGNTALMSDDLPMLKMTAAAMDRIKADASVLDDRPELGVVRSFGAGGQSAVRGAIATVLAGPAWLESFVRDRDGKFGFMHAFDTLTAYDRANDEAGKAFRPNITDSIAHTVGALPVYVVPGVGAARIGQLAGAGVKAAVSASAMIQAAQTGTQAVYDFSKSNMERGVGPLLTPTQYAYALGTALVTGAINRVAGTVGELAFLQRAGTRFGATKAVAGGFASEGSEELIQSGFEAAGKGDPYYTEDAAFATIVGGVLGGGMAVPHAAAIALSTIKRDVAEPVAKSLDAIASAQSTAEAVEAAKAQKLSQRSLTRLASQLTELAGDQKVYFTADDWTKVWTDAKMDPVDAIQKFGGSADAGMVEIDAGKYVVNLISADDGIKAALFEAQRKTPESQSVADSKAILELLVEQEKQAQETLLPSGAVDDSDIIADTLRGQLVKAGISERDAADYANLQAAVYRTAAENFNRESGDKLTPKALFDLKPVSVGGGTGKVESKDRGTYDPTTGTISMTGKRDRSTMLHESAHHFLELTSFMVEQSGGKGHFAGQMTEFRGWVERNAADVAKQHNDIYGTNLTADEVKATAFDEAGKTANFEAWRAQHEYFARGFEKWLTEGKAPDVGMRGMFRRFASWLRKIYTDLRLLGVNLDDRSREMFKRLVATQEIIDVADAEARRAEITVDALVKAGIPQADAEVIANRNRDAIDATFGKAVEKMARTIKAEDRRARRDFREKRFTEIMVGSADAPPEFTRMPSVQGALARSIITGDDTSPDATSRGAYGHLVLEDDAKEALSEDTFKTMKERGYLTTDKSGIKMEDLVLEFAASNPQELADEMLTAPDWKEAVDRVIDEEEKAKFGPEVTPEQAVEIATEAAYGTERSEASSAVARKMQEVLRRANVAATPEQKAQAKKDAANAIKSAVEEVKAAAEEKELFLKGVIGMREAAAETQEKLRKLDEKIAAKKQKQAEAEARAKLLEDQKQDVAESLAFLGIDMKAVEVAQAVIAEKLTRSQLRPGRWNSAANGYAAKAAKALEDGNWAKFGEAKHNEAVALQRAKVEDELRRDYDRAKAKIERFVKSGGKELLIGNKAYRDFANNLLFKFGFGTQPAVSKSVLNVVPLVPNSVVSSPGFSNVADIPVGLMLDLNDALDATISSHEMDEKSFTAGVKAGIRKRTEDLADTAEKNAPKKRPSSKTILAALGKFVRLNNRVVSYLTVLDGGKDGSYTELADQLNRAETKKESILRNTAKELEPAIQSLNPWAKPVAGFPDLKMSEQERVMFAAHWGSDSGRKRAKEHLDILVGSANVDKAAAAILDSLSPKALDTLELMWRINDNLFKLQVAQHEELHTPPPKPVQNAPFKVGNRQLGGGYMTLRYLDHIHYSTIDSVADDVQDYRDQSQPKAGFEKARAEEHRGELDLRINVELAHVNEVARVLAFRPIARDIRRIWEGGLGQKITDLYGADFGKETKDAIDLAIVGPPPPPSMVERGLSMFRRNTTAASLMFNLNSAVSQFLGVPASISEIGVKAFTTGFTEYMANPLAAVQKAKDLHPGMAQRMGIADPNMMDVSNAASRAKILNPVIKYGFVPMTFAQSQVDTITFLGAYDKAKAQYPGKGSDYWADRAFAAVKAAQGGASDVDMTSLHKNQVLRLLTMFGTAFANMSNQYYVAAATKDYKKFANHLFWIGVVTTVAGMGLTALRGGAPDDEEYLDWYMRNTLKHFVDLNPVLRVGSNAIMDRGTMRIPGLRPVEAAYRLPGDIVGAVKGDTEWSKAAADATRMMSGAVPLPTVQALRAAEAAIAALDGNAGPFETVRDATIGREIDPKKR